MKKLILLMLAAGCGWNVIAQPTNAGAGLPAWLTRPLSLADSLNLALQQNATILKARNDLEASQGVVVQTRAVALPQVQANGQYKDTEPAADRKLSLCQCHHSSFLQATESKLERRHSSCPDHLRRRETGGGVEGRRCHKKTGGGAISGRAG